MIRQEESMKIVKETLSEDYLHLELKEFQIEEAEENQQSKVIAKIHLSLGDDFTVESYGVGALNAFFVGLRDVLSETYPSVKTLVFSSLRSKNLPQSVQEHPTDATAEVQIWTQNSNGDEFEFVTCSRSFVRAAFMGIVEAFEYFVNSERTYVQLLRALEHYKKEGRSELVDKYTALLGQIVRNTSYSEVSRKVKAGQYK